MSQELLVGVDVGTYEAKGTVATADGRVVARAAREHQMAVPRPGWAEHDAETVWWDGFLSVVRELLDVEGVDADAVAGIGVSGIGPCVLPVDGAGRPLRPAILYGVDTRATEQIATIAGRLGEEAIVERCGNSLSSQSAGPKIAWIREHEPEVFRATARFVTSQTFLVGRLTGRWVMDHGTAGYFHPLYDLAATAWYEPWLEDIVRPEQLPELDWATAIAGGVTATAAEATGLRAGTPVIVGTTDAPAEAVSAGVTSPGRMMIMYGSSVFMIEMLDSPVSTDLLWAAPYVFPGSYVLAAGTSTAGTLTRWFRQLVTGGHGDPPSFSELSSEAAASPPGARGLISLPYFSGERTPVNDPGARGVLAGLDLTHERGDVFRALLEGIARGVAANLDAYTGHDARPTELRAVGGGTRNAVWVQAVSDASQRRQHVVSGTGASYGDAALAARATGLLDDLDRWVEIDREVVPAPELAELYERQQRLATELYEKTRDIIGTLHGGLA